MKKVKRLVLAKETVRNLERREITAVLGALQTLDSGGCTWNCSWETCGHTQQGSCGDFCTD
jgi:hypothetical protein